VDDAAAAPFHQNPLAQPAYVIYEGVIYSASGDGKVAMSMAAT
jgi:hypothetical protein